MTKESNIAPRCLKCVSACPPDDTGHHYAFSPLRRLGFAELKKGEYKKPIKLLIRALNIHISLNNENDSSHAYISNVLGSIYYFKGEVNKAFDLSSKAINMIAKIFQEVDPMSIAESLNNLGLVLSS